jgi:hypothetical protein
MAFSAQIRDKGLSDFAAPNNYNLHILSIRLRYIMITALQVNNNPIIYPTSYHVHIEAAMHRGSD